MPDHNNTDDSHPPRHLPVVIGREVTQLYSICTVDGPDYASCEPVILPKFRLIPLHLVDKYR
jgi:hypothetical protein